MAKKYNEVDELREMLATRHREIDVLKANKIQLEQWILFLERTLNIVQAAVKNITIDRSKDT